MKVYLDMDGVIADFIGKMIENYPNETEASFRKIPDDKFWPMVMAIDDFWHDLPLMPDAKNMFKFLYHNYDLEILSSPSKHDSRSLLGKHYWLNKHFSKTKYSYERNFVRAKNKKDFADSNSILIDDLEKNIKEFKSAGGHGILFKNFTQVKSELKKLK
jgi:5'(3')-deoxyribonucleotidase